MVSDDESVVVSNTEASDCQVILAGNSGSTTITMAVSDKNTRQKLASTTFRVTVTAPSVSASDGTYIDGTTKVSEFEYTPQVQIVVENDIISDVVVTSEDVGSNKSFLDAAAQWLRDGLIGMNAETASVDAIDATSGATYAKNALRTSARKALTAENLITYLDNDKELFRAYVTTGTATPVIEDPQGDSSRNFAGWDPVVAPTVAGDAAYLATWSSLPVASIVPSKTELDLNQEANATVKVLAEHCSVQALSSDPSVVQTEWNGSELTVKAGKPGAATITLTGTPDNGYAAPESRTIEVKVYRIVPDGKYVNGSIEITETHEEYYSETSSTYHANLILTVKDGKITSVKTDSDANWVDSQWFEEYASTRIQELVGKTASELDIGQLDAVSGATFSTTALRKGAIEALKAEYEVTWNNYDGTELDRAWTATDTMPVYDGEAPTRENHQFAGWEPEPVPVAKDAVYTAAYIMDPQYTVTYDLNGGSGDIQDEHLYFAGDTVTVSQVQPVRNGFKFVGWSISGGTFQNGQKTFTIGKGNATLKAIWEEIQSVGLYGSYETTDVLYEIYSKEFGEGSDREFDITFDYLLEGTEIPLLVTMEIGEGNQIDIDSIHVDIESDEYDASYFEDAVQAIRNMLETYGPDATVENLQFIWTMLWVDEMDGAEMNGYSDIMLAMIHALEQGRRNELTVEFADDDGHSIAQETVKYGTRTESIVPEVPARFGRTLTAWEPDLAPFVVEDTAYQGVYTSEDSIRVMGHNLNLAGSIGVSYYIHLTEDVLADEGASVHFDLPNGLKSDVPVQGTKVFTVKGEECRQFSCYLHSSQMTGTILASVVLSDGTVSDQFPYSVKEYADIIIANESNNAAFTKVTPLIKAMLNYGGYAQEYFRYDDTPLANKDLTDEERNAIHAVTAEDVKDYERVIIGTQEGLNYEGSNLVLTSETSIRHYFTVESGHDISEYTFKVGGTTLSPVQSDGMYYVQISNIASGELDKTYTLTVGGITVKYSALSYVYTQLSKENLDETLANTLKALYLYNQEANLYFEK